MNRPLRRFVKRYDGFLQVAIRIAENRHVVIVASLHKVVSVSQGNRIAHRANLYGLDRNFLFPVQPDGVLVQAVERFFRVIAAFAETLQKNPPDFPIHHLFDRLRILEIARRHRLSDGIDGFVCLCGHRFRHFFRMQGIQIDRDPGKGVLAREGLLCIATKGVQAFYQSVSVFFAAHRGYFFRRKLGPDLFLSDDLFTTAPVNAFVVQLPARSQGLLAIRLSVFALARVRVSSDDLVSRLDRNDCTFQLLFRLGPELV